MKLIIDTRETKPLKFRRSKNFIEIVREKLDVGDYAVEFDDGTRSQIIFERKSIGDLFGTLGKGYKRFKKELIRAQESNIVIVVIIEVPLETIKAGYRHTKRSGTSVIDQLFTLMLKHHVPFICCSSRADMKLYIRRAFIALQKEHLRKLKDKS